jgi:hypothetical protein
VVCCYLHFSSNKLPPFFICILKKEAVYNHLHCVVNYKASFHTLTTMQNSNLFIKPTDILNT